MEAQLGPAYARSWAADTVVTELGGRTVDEALAAGDDAKGVWRAVCEEFEVPAKQR